MRTDDEWGGGHLPGALHIMGGYLPDTCRRVPDDRPLVVMCGSGYRSTIAASILARAGRTDVTNLTGGMQAWQNAGGEIVEAKREYPGVTNFTRIDATVAFGGATTPEAIASLHADGFTTIVNLREAQEECANLDAEVAAAKRVGIHYVHLPFRTAEPDPAVVDRFLAVVTDPASLPLFIHCATANRVSALWLIKRVRHDGWAFDRALAEAHIHRPHQRAAA